MNLFVTGTDTGVGKTHTVVQVLRLLRNAGESCAGFKPICCGDRRDAELLLEASCCGLTIDDINPLWLKTPAAPIVAARVDHIEVKVERLIDAFHSLRERVPHVLVEGAGGWLVPITADYSMSDLAAEMKLPVLIVAQNRLGCLNHTALTEQSVKTRGLHCAGVVLNALPDSADIAEQTNAEVLRQIIHAPVLSGLNSKMAVFPPDWRSMIKALEAVEVSLK